MNQLVVLMLCGLVAMVTAAIMEVQSPNVMSKVAIEAGISVLSIESRMEQMSANVSCCPHGQPYKCPQTTTPLRFFSLTNPRRYCKVLNTCHNETVEIAECSCSGCNYGSTLGRCVPRMTSAWAMVMCFNFDDFALESASWQQVRVASSCYCDRI